MVVKAQIPTALEIKILNALLGKTTPCTEFIPTATVYVTFGSL